jgi:hypothetical protein
MQYQTSCSLSCFETLLGLKMPLLLLLQKLLFVLLQQPSLSDQKQQETKGMILFPWPVKER